MPARALAGDPVTVPPPCVPEVPLFTFLGSIALTPCGVVGMNGPALSCTWDTYVPTQGSWIQDRRHVPVNSCGYLGGPLLNQRFVKKTYVLVRAS